MSARLVTVPRFLVVTRTARLTLFLIALIALLSSTQGLWYAAVPEGTVWFGLSNQLVGIRRWTVSIAERAPELAGAVLYDPRRPVDWHLLLMSVLLYALRRPLAAVGGWAFTPRLRLTFDVAPTAISVRVGLFRRLRLRRDDPARPFTIRSVDPEHWNAQRSVTKLQRALALGENAQPSAIIELNTGLRRRRLVMAVRADRAEAVVARCHEALRETGTLIPR